MTSTRLGIFIARMTLVIAAACVGTQADHQHTEMDKAAPCRRGKPRSAHKTLRMSGPGSGR